MKNKRVCNVNVIFAKCKCIKDIFVKNTGGGGNSITHRWMLMLPTSIRVGTVGAAAPWLDGGVVMKGVFA